MNYITKQDIQFVVSEEGKISIDNKLGIIHIVDFDEGSLCQFIDGYQAALNSGSKILPIEIDSYGGEVDVLNGMLSYIEDFKSKGGIVVTFCGSKAMSCGSVLLASGTKGYRFVSPRAHVMIHQVSGVEFGKLNDVLNGAKQQALLNSELFSYLDIAAGKESGYFEELCTKNKNSDVFLTAKQCVEHGIVDEIKIPTLTATIQATYKIE